MKGFVRERFPSGQWRQPCRLWIGVMLAVTLSVQLQAADPVTTRPTQSRAVQTRPAGGGQASTRPAARGAGDRSPARSPKVDHAVVPAGGMAAGQARCSQCQRSACPQCRLAEAHHHGHSQCQHGLCPAHCPVRPDVFGFYGTRWRRWPGSGAVQASNNEAATPARPPRAEVPGADEESLEPDAPPAEDLPAPAAEDLPIDADKSEPAQKTPAAGDPPSSARPAADEEAAAMATDPEDAAAVEPSRASQSALEATQEGSGDGVVSPTAWRTFTTAPPRLAVQR